jgi:hypothetical protein
MAASDVDGPVLRECVIRGNTSLSENHSTEYILYHSSLIYFSRGRLQSLNYTTPKKAVCLSDEVKVFCMQVKLSETD